MALLDAAALKSLPTPERIRQLQAAMTEATSGAGRSDVAQLAQTVGVGLELQALFPDVFKGMGSPVGSANDAPNGPMQGTGRGVGPIGLRFDANAAAVNVEVPVVGTKDRDMLFALAKAFLREGKPVLAFAGEHLDALIGAEKLDWAGRDAFKQKAVAEWPELKALGIFESYQLSSLEPQRPRIDEGVKKARAALKPFVDGPTTMEGRAALQAFADAIGKAIDGALKDLHKDGLGALRDTWALDTIKDKLAVLSEVALLTGSSAAGGALADKLAKLDTLDTLRGIGWLSARTSTGTDSAGDDASAIARLYGHPELVDDAVKLVRAHVGPELRDALYAQLAGASTLWRADNTVEIVLDRSHDFARRIHDADKSGKPFAPTFGSTPLLARLFPFGGRDMKVTPKDPQQPAVVGRFAGAADWDPDKEGTAPSITLQTADKSARLEMPLVSKIEVGGQTVYDAAVDGVVPRRAFEANNAQVALADLVGSAQVLGDYDVSKDSLDALVRVAVFGEKLPPDHKAYRHERFDDFVTAGNPPFPVDAALVDAYRTALVLKDEGVRGSYQIQEALQAAMLGPLALDLLSKDLGPTRARDAAYLGVAAAWQRGYKTWGIDMGAMLRDGGSMSAAVQAATERTRDALELLQHGSPEVKTAIVRQAVADAPKALVDTLASWKGVDDRLEPLVRLLAGDAASRVKFVPTGSA